MRKADDGEKFAALAFSSQWIRFVGQLTFVRVYSGYPCRPATVYNPVKARRADRPVLQMREHSPRRSEEIRAGDIAACVGLKEVTTGETLCDPIMSSCSSGWNSRSR
ncbi:MAG: hypothetical protein R3E48_10570 [Burkholderiaceae bacterium]